MSFSHSTTITIDDAFQVADDEMKKYIADTRPLDGKDHVLDGLSGKSKSLQGFIWLYDNTVAAGGVF